MSENERLKAEHLLYMAKKKMNLQVRQTQKRVTYDFAKKYFNGIVLIPGGR
jgi:hypothetical protein